MELTEKKQAKSEYYDNLYKDSSIYKMSDVAKTPYYETYKKIIKQISKKSRVADFGCGCGHFAKMCLLNGRNYVAGYDFSPVAVEKAKALVPEYADKFFVKDLFDESIDLTNFDVVVFCEVLEHIDKDLELLAKIPELVQVVLTVPNYESDSHVRIFKDEAEVIERYKAVLFIKSISTVDIYKLNGSKIFILNGVRKWSY